MDIKVTKINEGPYPVVAVANLFIERSLADKNPVTHLKLQKLAYLSHCAFVRRDKKSSFDEYPEAWRHGPVFPGLYHMLKYCGRCNVNRKRLIVFDILPEVSNKKDVEVLQSVWNDTGEYTAKELSNLTHQEGSPWKKVYVEDMNRAIGVEDILACNP